MLKMNQDEREMFLQKLAEANAQLQKTQEELDAANKRLNEYEE